MEVDQIRIAAPEDYDYSPDAYTNLSPCSFQPSEDIFPGRTRKKKRKNTLSQNGSFYLGTIRKKKNNFSHFESEFKKSKSNGLAHLFLRKLKQGLTKTGNLPVFLSSLELEEKLNYLQTFEWNYHAEIVYTIMTLILTLVACILASLEMTFGKVLNKVQTQIASSIFFIFILLELVFKITSRSSIDITHSTESFLFVRDSWRNYERKSIIIDVALILIFLVDVFMDHRIVTDLKILFLLKLPPMSEKLKNLQILLIKKGYREQYWELIKVFLFNFLLSHVLALLLILMAGHSQSWLIQNNLQSDAWYIQYIWAYYWATTIMLTVGFGDLTPTNTKQALMMIFIQTFSCVVFAYNINKIGIIINNITSYEAEKLTNLKVFSQMEQKQQISEDINRKITNYIKQSTELKRNFNIDNEMKLLQKLPTALYEQFKKQSTIKIFTNIPFFRNLYKSKLMEISLKIQKKLTHPEEIIIECHSVPAVIIANNGHISFNISRPGAKKNGQEIQFLKIDRKEFKLLSLYFFCNKPINYDVKCKDNTIIYSITKFELEKIMSTNSYCYEYYCMVRDKDSSDPGHFQTELCQQCDNKVRHNRFNCPKLHYIPMKSMIVFKALKNRPQEIRRLMKNQRKRVEHLGTKPLFIYSDMNDDLYTKQTSLNEQIMKCFQKEPKDKNLVYMEKCPTPELYFSKKLSQSFESDNVVGKSEQLTYYQTINAKTIWNTQCDSAHDFAFYFSKDNPSKLIEKYRSSIVKKKS